MIKTFADDFRPRLLRLAASLGATRGDAPGRARRAGGVVEFRDLRPYVPGDDVRRLDWAAFLRGAGLTTRTYEADDAPATDVLLDRSASHGPAGSRQDALSRELAAAAGFLALAGGGVARLFALGAGPPRVAAVAKGRRDGEAWIRACESLDEPEGVVDWRAAVAAPLVRGAGSTVVLVSDLLAEPVPTALFAALARSARAATLMPLAHDDPFAEESAGRVGTLADPETGAVLMTADDREWRAAVAAERAAHAEGVRALCAARGVSSAVASGREPFEDVVRAAGLLG